MIFAIIFGAMIIGDAICYVHGHRSWFYTAKKDYEKELIRRIHDGE